jgi:hypothetical protein
MLVSGLKKVKLSSVALSASTFWFGGLSLQLLLVFAYNV